MKIMWLLGQIVEILLVIFGLNALFALLRTPFVWYSERKNQLVQSEPVDYAAEQRAIMADYRKRLIDALPTAGRVS